jgi:hypothetical protein
MQQYRYHQSGKLKIYSRIVRSCFALSESERLVLLFIMDRSIERGRSFALIPMREFENGVTRKKDGKRVSVVRGTGLSSKQVAVAIDALQEIGAITASCGASQIFCHINEEWLHPDLPKKGKWAIWGLNESDYDYSIDHHSD